MSLNIAALVQIKRWIKKMLQINSKVYHPQCGEGTVVSKTIANGNALYEIKFHNHSQICSEDNLFDNYTDFAERLAPDYHR